MQRSWAEFCEDATRLLETSRSWSLLADSGKFEVEFSPKGRLYMKNARLSEEQIVAVLRQVEMAAKVLDVCRKHGISDAIFYNWKTGRRATVAWTYRSCGG